MIERAAPRAILRSCIEDVLIGEVRSYRVGLRPRRSDSPKRAVWEQLHDDPRGRGRASLEEEAVVLGILRLVASVGQTGVEVGQAPDRGIL